jgi:hypothetical protein
MTHQNSMIIWKRTITRPSGTKYSTYFMHRDAALKGVDNLKWCGSDTNIGHGTYLGDTAWVRNELLLTNTGE